MVENSQVKPTPPPLPSAPAAGPAPPGGPPAAAWNGTILTSSLSPEAERMVRQWIVGQTSAARDTRDRGVSEVDRESDLIRKALFTESFIQSVVMLFLGAIITGVLAPVLIDHYKSVSQRQDKARDIQRMRDESVITAQAALLDEVSRLIWTYETLALDVTWAKTEVEDEALTKAAWNKYGKQMDDLIIGLRTQISKARYLSSRSTAKKLEEFLRNTIIVEQDDKLTSYMKNGAADGQWRALHKEFENSYFPRAKDLINQIADDVNLNKEQLYRKESVAW